MQRTSTAHASETSKISRMLGASLLITLALIVLYGTGFAGPEVLHNAAHDVRHGFAFPCH